MRDLIFGLARPMLNLLGRDERGAVGVLIGVLLGGGVLLGIGALVIDVGFLYSDRASLQNGADAGAIAVAETCVAGTCDTNLAQSYATANQHVWGSTAYLVCGSGSLGTCPGGTGAMTDCPPPPQIAQQNGHGYVDVHTSTTGVVPPFFARALANNGKYTGTTVRACGQAIWGPASQSDSLALTISLCAWQDLLGPDNDADAATSVDTDNDSDDNGAFNTPIALYLQTSTSSPTDYCKGPAGQNVPGGFDWLSTDTDITSGKSDDGASDSDHDGDASNTCTAAIDLVTSTSYNNTGANISSACQTVLQNDVASYVAGSPVTVYLPVFDSTNGTGGNATYHMIGLAGFVIMGYANLHPLADAGTHTACTGNGQCIEGYFRPGLDPVGPVGSGTSFGAFAVQLTG
jgi:Flp pilus assembly protein TadG